MMRDLNLLGTPFSLMLFYCGYQLPFTIFLYAGYMRTLPPAYEEAARIDGATDLQLFRHVIFPMIRPITGAVLILDCVFIWNDFMTPLLYLQGSSWATIPVAVSAFVDQEITDWGVVFAALLIGVTPVMLLWTEREQMVLAATSLPSFAIGSAHAWSLPQTRYSLAFLPVTAIATVIGTRLLTAFRARLAAQARDLVAERDRAQQASIALSRRNEFLATVQSMIASSATTTPGKTRRSWRTWRPRTPTRIRDSPRWQP